MAWAATAGAREVHVLVNDCAPLAARRAGYFTDAPTVWQINERSVVPATAAPLNASPPPPPEALALAPILAAAGADVVVEHGAVTGEVLGLEVARVVVDDSGARVEVGVGRHDREAFALVHGDVPAEAALATVVTTVRRNRRADAPNHPLRHLVAERWLREVVVARPELVGASLLERIEGPAPRLNVKDMAPAAAAGVDTAGRPVVVACSVGIDLEVVPWAADARAAHDASARLVIAVPERDAHAITSRLAAALADPAEVVAVPAGWRSLPSI